jgi:HNH endonuclease
MTRYFTHYWQNQTWELNRDIGAKGDLLEHCASNLFTQRGVSSDDFVYVITVKDGQLYLCAKMQVAMVCTDIEAAEYLNRELTDLWEANEHIVAHAATPQEYNFVVPENITKSLRFLNKNAEKPLVFDALGRLDKQTLRGVRELSLSSAAQLDKLLPEMQLLFEGVLGSVALGSINESLLDEERVKRLYEGGVKSVIVNVYERNSMARQLCIEYYGWQCYICGFDFCKKYGEVGKEFIHVHHLLPVSQIGERYTVDPIKDLRPVCPNCHAIIHRRKLPYSIEEMKQLIFDYQKMRDRWE